MAKIKIRGRFEPIEIDNARAQKVKDRKFGNNGIEKAEATDVVDLGEWAGEYGRIVEIEMTIAEKRNSHEQDRATQEEEERRRQWLALSPEEKGKATGRFKLSYSVRTGEFKKDPPADVMGQVIERQTKFFTENPTAEMCPVSVLEDLLPKQQGETLAEKMSV